MVYPAESWAPRVRAHEYMLARICHADSVRLSVRPSVTRVLCVKTAERIIEILSLSDRPIILVFRQGCQPSRIFRVRDSPEFGCCVPCPERLNSGQANVPNFTVQIVMSTKILISDF